jgi:hypothetical protein
MQHLNHPTTNISKDQEQIHRNRINSHRTEQMDSKALPAWNPHNLNCGMESAQNSQYAAVSGVQVDAWN